jgi:pimeloyl-ACP methyl ester carboxylesterase
MGLGYRAGHPEDPVKFWALPPSINEAFRGYQSYDPRFGEAFFTDTWDAGWSQEQTLGDIHVPAVYIHTSVSVGDDGILRGANTDAEAATVRSLIPGVEFHQVDTGHNFHGEAPQAFVTIVTDLAARLSAAGRP